MTLNSLANALEGRGERARRRPSRTSAATSTRSSRSCPPSSEDLVALADVADTYDLAAPDLLRVLGNLTVTSRTVLQKRQQLDVFFSDLTGLSDTTTRVLRSNESALIRSGEVGAPVLKLLATYSPELPCLLQGVGTLRADPGQDLRGQPGQAVPRARSRAVRGLRPRRPSRVRRDRARPVVLGPAQAARADRSGVLRRRHRHRRQPADGATCRCSSRTSTTCCPACRSRAGSPVGRRRRLRARHVERVRRQRPASSRCSTPCSPAQRTDPRHLRLARLPALRTRRPRGRWRSDGTVRTRQGHLRRRRSSSRSSPSSRCS